MENYRRNTTHDHVNIKPLIIGSSMYDPCIKYPMMEFSIDNYVLLKISIVVLIDQQLFGYILLNMSIVVLIDQQLFDDRWDQRRRPNITGILIGT